MNSLINYTLRNLLYNFDPDRNELTRKLLRNHQNTAFVFFLSLSLGIVSFLTDRLSGRNWSFSFSFSFWNVKRYPRICTRQRCRSTVNIFRAGVMLLVYQLAFCDTRSAIFAPVSSKQIVAGIIREPFWENGCGANISEPRVTRDANTVRKNRLPSQKFL